jgi:hypothetical protein
MYWLFYENNIYMLIWKKFDFCKEKIIVLGYIISEKGIKMDEKKG